MKPAHRRRRRAAAGGRPHVAVVAVPLATPIAVGIAIAPLFHASTATGPEPAWPARPLFPASKLLPSPCVSVGGSSPGLQGMPVACLASAPRPQIVRLGPTAGRVRSRRFSACRAMSAKEVMHGHYVASLGEALYGEAAQGAARLPPPLPPGPARPPLATPHRCTSGPPACRLPGRPAGQIQGGGGLVVSWHGYLPCPPSLPWLPPGCAAPRLPCPLEAAHPQGLGFPSSPSYLSHQCATHKPPPFHPASAGRPTQAAPPPMSPPVWRGWAPAPSSSQPLERTTWETSL